MTPPAASEHPVVFLHDAFVDPGAVGALADLGRDWELVLPRHPGFNVPADEVPLEWDGIDDLVMHHLLELRRSGQPVHLAGAGLGGWVALEIALRCPAVVCSLVLVCPYGVRRPDLAPTVREFADVLLLDPQEIVDLGWADPARVSCISLPGVPPAMGDEALEAAFAARAALARYGWRPYLHRPGLGRWLASIEVPAVVVSGAQDGLISDGNGRFIARELPAGHHVEIEDCGHYPYLERPEEFLCTVRIFLEGVRSQP